MTRAVILSVLSIVALVGCRAPAPTFAPYGPQTVPPPVTGSIGTPAPQPAPYYQGSNSTTVSPQISSNGGWRAPSTNLATQPLVQTQPPANTTLNSTPTIGNGIAPNANFTSTNGQTFSAPQVTNPATIQSQGVISPPVGGSSTPAQPWQGSGGTITTPQLLQTNTPTAQPATQPSTNLGQPAPTTGQGGTTWGQQPQPTSRWGQPPVNTGAQLQIGPNGAPLNGMHVNDATATYGGASSPWSMAGVRNWLRTNFSQPNYVTPAAYNPQPVYQTQVVPAGGYSTSAPAPTQLPVRGAQQNWAPASQPATTTGGVQNAPVAPAAPQWGSVPMASSNPTGTTVRGNDDGDNETKPIGFVTTNQSSVVPHEAELFGQHESYLWLRGQLEYSASQRQWKLRYIPLDAPEGRMDSYGGSVVLTDNAQLKSYRSGDFVLVKGRLAGGSTGQSGFAPLYELQSVSKL